MLKSYMESQFDKSLLSGQGPIPAPPPVEIDIRTMQSDIDALKQSGGEVPLSGVKQALDSHLGITMAPQSTQPSQTDKPTQSQPAQTSEQNQQSSTTQQQNLLNTNTDTNSGSGELIKIILIILLVVIIMAGLGYLGYAYIFPKFFIK